MTVDGLDRAWAWVGHLRAGGTTAWARWSCTEGPHGRVVPGAQQLELLRRLNLAGRPSPGLAERVLAANAPGRGQLDLQLVGSVPDSPFGPRPVDPADLSPGELLRVATSVMAEDLVAAGTPEPGRAALTRPWRRKYTLAGDPLVATTVRQELAGRGRPPGGTASTAYVLAGPLDLMLADTWTRRCFEQGTGRWPEWLRHWQGRSQLPPRIDLVAVADALARRHGTVEVRVVLDHTRLPAELGVRRLAAPRRPGAEAVELARRVAAVLGLLVVPARRERLLGGTLWPRLADVGGAPIALPDEQREWVARRATRMARGLRRAGYPVVGDLASLVPGPPVAPVPAGGPTDAGVLDLAVRMLLDERVEEQG
jgi:hypothetical protein